MDIIWLNLPVLAPLLIGFYYAFFGFWNLYHWTPLIEMMTKENLPHPYLWLPLGIAWQTLLGFMIIFGLYVKLAALLLMPFTLLASFIFHPFWRFKGNIRMLHFSIFIMNITIVQAALLSLMLPLNGFIDIFT